MNKGVTILRGAGVVLPDDYLEKVLSQNKTSASYAVANSTGGSVVLRRHRGEMSLEDAKTFLGHKALANRQLVISFGNNPNLLTDDDVQPFPVLLNAEGKPLMVAFLNGDFSLYAQEKSVTSNEFLCVQKDIIPRIARLNKFLNGDVKAIMEELKGDIDAKEFANFMLGSEGAITLLAANGDVHSFLPAEESSSKAFEGWWTSDTLEGNVSSDSGSEETETNDDEDDLYKELGDEPAPKKEAVPSAAPTGKKGAVAAPPKSGSVATPDKKKAVASVADRSAAANAAIQTAAHVAGPSSDLTFEDVVLTIKIPPGMKQNTKHKWIKHRMPEGMVPNKISGLSEISCKRSQATPKFIETYLKDNKLSGLDALKSTTAVKTSASVPKVAPIPGEKGYPERAEDTAPAIPVAPKEPESEPKTPGVVEGPMPIFSPNQKEEMLNFVNHDTTVSAVDRHGKVISNPQGIELMEKKVKSFEAQFDGKLTIASIASWPMETFLQYAKHDANAVAKMAFWLSIENLKLNSMLNELTDPHINKKKDGPVVQNSNAVVPQHTVSAPTKKGHVAPPPSRKTA